MGIRRAGSSRPAGVISSSEAVTRLVLLLLALLAARTTLVAQTPPSPGPPPRGDASIAGRVLDEAGAPLEDATVIAYWFSGTPSATAEFRATSATDGGYRLAALPGGRYRIVAEKRGFSNRIVQGNRIAQGTMIDLDPAGSASGIDLVLRASGTIEGRVTRPDGAPVADARVVPQLRQDDGRLLGVQQGAVTDSNGRYRIEDVPQGSYLITAMYSVLREMMGKPVPAQYREWARTFHPAAIDEAHAARIEVRGGDVRRGVDITLQPQMVYGIRGTITDSHGRVPADLQLEYVSGTGASGGASNFPKDSGHFDLNGFAPGRVTLYASGEIDGVPVAASEQVEIAGASLTDVRLIVGKPGRLAGRLIAEGGTLPPGALVALSASSSLPPNRSGRRTPTATVSASGQFAIDGLVGVRTLDITQLPPEWTLKEVRRRGAIVPGGRFVLEAGESIDDIEVVIVPR